MVVIKYQIVTLMDQALSSYLKILEAINARQIDFVFIKNPPIVAIP